MAKITKFDPQNLNALRVKIDAALAEVEKEFGLKIDIGKITYGANTFNAKMTAVIASGNVADSVVSDVPAKYVSDLIRQKGDNAVGRSIDLQGNAAIVVGIRGQSYIFKYAENTPAARRNPGLRKIAYRPFDKIDCQVIGEPFNQAKYDLMNWGCRKPGF